MSRVHPTVPKTLAALFGGGTLTAALAAFADTAAIGHPFAAPQAAGQTAPTGVSGLSQVTLALLIVLCAVFAIAWLVRRMRGFGNRVPGAIDVLADIPLGQKERAVLLKVGPTHVLVGVAPGRVNTLHVLAEPLELPKPLSGSSDSRPTFKSLMLRSLGK